MRSGKASECEPSVTCRNENQLTSKPGCPLPRDKLEGSLLTARAASGIKMARARIRPLCGTWEPVAVMLREEPKR